MLVEEFNNRLSKICHPILLISPALDIITTYLALNYFHLYELNPLVSNTPFFAYAILYIALFLGIYELAQFDSYVGVITKSMFITLSLISFSAGINNIFQIIRTTFLSSPFREVIETVRCL
ncbi:MAG: hypothetical protein QXE05_04840 [Nitrososphaeria archaeon]